MLVLIIRHYAECSLPGKRTFYKSRLWKSGFPLSLCYYKFHGYATNQLQLSLYHYYFHVKKEKLYDNIFSFGAVYACNIYIIPT